jgi:hypothetical protein
MVGIIIQKTLRGFKIILSETLKKERIESVPRGSALSVSLLKFDSYGKKRG